MPKNSSKEHGEADEALIAEEPHMLFHLPRHQSKPMATYIGMAIHLHSGVD